MNTEEIILSKAKILNQELDRRKLANASYSLRAFARDLGISHTLLSLILKGRRSVSVDLAKKMLSKLSLEKKEQDLLSLGIPKKDINIYDKVSLDFFAMMSDWTYYAALNLLNIENIDWNREEIALRLGITKTKAETIITRLEKLGIIAKVDGEYKRIKENIVVENTVPHDACKKFHKGLLKKAEEIIDNGSFEKRDASASVFTVDPQFIPYAVERIRNFRRSLMNELENLGEQQEVYSLAVQLFPLTQDKDKT